MVIKGKLMDADGMGNTFRRLAHQVIEMGGGAEGLVLIGIRTRGVTVAKRIKACIDSIEGTDVPLGVFDIALYRDDLGELNTEVAFYGSEIGFGIDGKTVLICDDVHGQNGARRHCGGHAAGAPRAHPLFGAHRPRAQGTPVPRRFRGQERTDRAAGGDRRPLRRGRRRGRRVYLRKRERPIKYDKIFGGKTAVKGG